MENKEYMQDELFGVENQMDDLVDEMIEKYGKFLSLTDTLDVKDDYKGVLVSRYNSLLKQKQYLVMEIRGFAE